MTPTAPRVLALASLRRFYAHALQAGEWPTVLVVRDARGAFLAWQIGGKAGALSGRHPRGFVTCERHPHDLGHPELPTIRELTAE